MELEKLIVHEIQKERGINETELILSDELIPVNNISLAMVNALNKSFGSDRILHAIFDHSVGKYFPEKFDNYMNSSKSSNDYINFTKNVTGNLEAIMLHETFATGGYLIFAEYISNGITFNSVFLVRDVEGQILRRTTNSFSIQNIEYVDTRNLAMACRINEDRINSYDSNYLSLTQLKQKEISEYFKNWISIQQLASSKEYTDNLYNIISQIPRPVNPDTNQTYEIEDFRGMIFDYIKSSPNKTVNIRDLSSHFYNSEATISNYANDNDIIIDTEFRYNNSALRRFVRLEVNRDGINLKFSRGIYNEKVRIDDNDSNIVIIESSSFANALRAEIGEN